MDVDEEWVDDADMSPELRAKIYSLKACRNRCLAHSKSKNAEEIAKPVLTMFSAIINNAGSLKQDSPDEYVPIHSISIVLLVDSVRSKKTKSRMRLQAASCLLRLAQIPVYASAISPNFIPLAIMIQVRSNFTLCPTCY